MDNHITEEPGGGQVSRSDGELYRAETNFLQDRIRDLQTDLQEQLTDLAVSTDQDSLPVGEFDLLATRQRLGRILRELLQTPERDREHLEGILEGRLGRTHAQLSAIEHTVEDKRAYDEAYWKLEYERQVLHGILEGWRHWLQDTGFGTREGYK